MFQALKGGFNPRRIVERPAFALIFTYDHLRLAQLGGFGRAAPSCHASRKFKRFRKERHLLLYSGQSVDIAGQKPATVALLAVYRHAMPGELCCLPASAWGH
jgi:hypothetical protein